MNATSVYADGANPEAVGETGAEQPPTQRVNTSRFGTVDVISDSIIAFPDGLIGLGGHSYALLRTDPSSPFLWLQSLDDPELALPVTNPHRFFKDFSVELEDSDAEQLGLDGGEAADVYVTVTASSVAADITVNLKAPILIADRRGHQVMNRRPNMAVKTPLIQSRPSGG
jgi:flagellar assembly factor FliW